MTDQPYVQIADVARHFVVSVSTIRAWVRKGIIPRNTYLKAGDTYRFKLSEVEAALRSSEEDETCETPAPIGNVDSDTQLEMDFDTSEPTPSTTAIYSRNLDGE